MIRMSMLRNVPVVYGVRQIGLLQNACFDQTRKRVCAFVVACGMRGKKIVPAQHVCELSEKFVLIDGMEKYRRADRQDKTMFIRDSTGQLVGRTKDYAIDSNTLEVLALEMLPGYGPGERRKRIWVYDYSFSLERGELSIPADLYRQPCLFGEGSNACEYPP